MIEALLGIASENYYSCELTRKIPVRVHLIAINGPEGFGIIESLDGTEKPLRKYAKFMNQSSNIVQFEITYRNDTQYWTRAVHSIDGASIHQTVLESGCMTRLPIIISNGWQLHSVLAPSQKEFSNLFDNLRERFSSVNLIRILKYPGGISTPILTSKQELAVRIAYTKGYYEIPRQCEIQQAANDLGIKRVAMQERLRRAERSIMREFVKKLGL
ncbi:hypothetical protein EU527_12690 [Candidatus Thorarchaeota archaeon]|nr:MAG: hypothetical protein EU527_12690 [Candidatus Thorarchaeota archaeon]